MRGLVRRAHREFVEIELAEHHRAVAPEIGSDGRLIGRHEAFEDMAARRGLHALGAIEILDAERNAFERPGLAPGDPRVGLAGHGERLLRRLDDKGIECSRLFDGADMSLREFDGGTFLLAKGAARFGERQFGKAGHLPAHSTTLGTTKK